MRLEHNFETLKTKRTMHEKKANWHSTSKIGPLNNKMKQDLCKAHFNTNHVGLINSKLCVNLGYPKGGIFISIAETGFINEISLHKLQMLLNQ